MTDERPLYWSLTDKTNDVTKLMRSRAAARALNGPDAQALIDGALARLDWQQEQGRFVPAFDEWRAILETRNVAAIQHVLTSCDQNSTRLRIDSPFYNLGHVNPALDFTDEDLRRRTYRKARRFASRDTSDIMSR